MAAITALAQDFEGTDGANASAGSIGAASITGGATPTFSAADVQQGTTALRILTAANQVNARYDFTAGPLAWFGIYFKTPSVAPAATTTLMTWAGDANVNNIGNVRLNTDMTMTIRDNNTAVYTTPTPLPVNTWVRIAVKAQPGSATGHRLRLYVGTSRHSVTPDFDSGNVTATNGIATNVDTFHVGLLTNGTNTVLYDRMRGDDAVEPAGVSVGGPPTVAAGPDLTKEVGSGTFTITGTAIPAGGATIASRSWQILSGNTVTLTGTTTDTVTVTAPTSTTGSTVLRYTATDTTGQSATDDVTLTWIAAGQTLYPAADVSNPGSWVTQAGSGSSLFATIDDIVLDAADYITSPQLTASAVVYRLRLQAKPVPSNTTGWYLSVNLSVTPDTVASSVVFKLYEADGTTLRKTWAAITTAGVTDAEVQLTLTSGEVAAITSWTSGLILEVSATGS